MYLIFEPELKGSWLRFWQCIMHLIFRCNSDSSFARFQLHGVGMITVYSGTVSKLF